MESRRTPVFPVKRGDSGCTKGAGHKSPNRLSSITPTDPPFDTAVFPHWNVVLSPYADAPSMSSHSLAERTPDSADTSGQQILCFQHSEATKRVEEPSPGSGGAEVGSIDHGLNPGRNVGFPHLLLRRCSGRGSRCLRRSGRRSTPCTGSPRHARAGPLPARW